jgi:uncharacterized protein (TIGR02246 family)
MRVLLGLGLCIALAGSWFAAAPGQDPAAGKEDAREANKEDAEILALFNKLTRAYADRDAKKFSALWSEAAEYFGEDEDERLVGRKAIEADFAARFAKMTQARLEIDIARVRFPRPDVAAVEGLARVLRPKEAPARSRFIALLVRTQGGWQIDSVRESNTPEPDSNADFLKDLAWLNGEWTYKNGATEIHLECAEVANGNFRTHKFRVQEEGEVIHEGTQIIGWDASTQQLRSWVFASDGSFGEGTVDNKGKTWTIRAGGVLPDGQRSTATQILTRKDDTHFTWEVVDRHLGTRALPNVSEITLTRSAAKTAQKED